MTLNGTSVFTVSNNSGNFNFAESGGSYGTFILNGSSKLVHNGAASGTKIGMAGTGVVNIASNTATVDVRNLIVGQGASGIGAVYNKGTLLSINLDGVFLGDGASSASYFRNDNAGAAANSTSNNLSIAIGLNSNSVVDIVSGTFASNSVRLGVGNNANANNSQLNVSGGQLTAGATGILVAENNNKWGNINLTGGTVTSTGPVNLGLGNNTGSTGLLSVANGTTLGVDI